jgi:transcriptional regulator with XRE-family HTH domain
MYRVDMTLVGASDFIGQRVKEVREQLGWTAEQLAARCAEIGAPEITRSVIANIESGRRDQDGRRRREVTVDELLTLSYALNVPPVYLFLPIQDTERLRVTDSVDMIPSQAAPWVTGDDTVNAYEIFLDMSSPMTDEDIKKWAHWRRRGLPVNYLRVVWALASRFDELSNQESGDAADSARREILGEIATIVGWFMNVGLTPPALPRSVVGGLRELMADDPSFAAELLVTAEEA